MRFDIKLMEAVALGAVIVKEHDGKYVFYRFTEEELACEANPNVHYSSGVRLTFKTDATALKIKLCVKNLAVREYFSLDIYCNGSILGSISNCDGSVEGFAEKKYILGDFLGEFPLPGGEKTVDVLLPHSVKCEIEYIELENATFVLPVKRQKVLLAYGDSITQGYDSLHPANTYASRLADALDAELYNKGLGGAPFCPHLVKAENGVKPDIITVAYGTNDWSGQSAEAIRDNIKNFFKELCEKYPSVPVFALSPIWRSDKDVPKAAGAFSVIEQMMREECGMYENVTVIDGLSLVPGNLKLFGDTRLHPNDQGFRYYAENLYKVIKNII